MGSPVSKPRSSPTKSSSTKKAFPAGIKELHKPADAVVDIVFVHGLTGDREKTWTAEDASEPWPKALLPSELPTARILTFGYNAYVADWKTVVSRNRVGNHAYNLLTSLAEYRDRDDTNERPTIFVCHSLGGLVCEDALCTSDRRTEPHLKNILLSTRGIIFLGTPHHGTALALWATLLSRFIGVVKQTNTRIVEVLKPDSEVLARIQNEFYTMVMARNKGPQPIEIVCFYEELPLPGVGQVVPQDSAILPGYVPIGICDNHMGMTKFASTDNPGFKAVCGELRRWTRQISKAPAHDGNPLPLSLADRSEDRQDGQDGSAGPAEPAGLQSRTGTFLVPHTSNTGFVGRSEILEELKSQLGHGQRQTNGSSQPRAALYGLGGIGKTQVALAYLYWLRDTCPEASVFWVYASNAERFRQAYASIAQECKIPGRDASKADVLLLVKNWLEKKDYGPWLMVIDNADDTQVFYGQQNGLGQYIPECSHGSILVTTRNMQAGLRLMKGKHPIEVKRMDEGESDQLIRAKLEGVHVTSAQSSALSSRLENLPLALVQAAAFIQENAITVDEYLRLLGKNDQQLVDLLSEEFETVGRDSETPHTVTETWMLSFEQVQRQHPFAGELLSLMSFLDRQAIPREFLVSYNERRPGQEPRGDLQLTKALGILKAFSFVVEDNGNTMNMHRLVQLVTRKWLAQREMAVQKEGGTTAMQQFAGQALLAVAYSYPVSEFENWTKCSAYLPHAYAVLNLEGAGSRDERLARAYLLRDVGGFLFRQGQWETAEKFQVEATEIFEAELGLEHPKTLANMNNLALTYKDQSRWKEAEALQVQVYETIKKVLGSEHLDTLVCMNNLASTYWAQGRWKEAETLQVQVYETIKKVLGSEHLNTLVYMNNLASMYRAQGRWKEAETLQVQEYETTKRVLGSEHPDTLTSMNNLASTYRAQGRWKEAETLQVQEYETTKRVLGPEHPDALISMNNLASTYNVQGRWKEAETLEVQVYETRKKVFGLEHPNTLTSINNLAFVRKSQGRLEEALGLMRECVRLRRQVLGPEHDYTLGSVEALRAWEEESESLIQGEDGASGSGPVAAAEG